MADISQTTARAEPRADTEERTRKPFEIPRIIERERLPVITAGSLNLW